MKINKQQFIDYYLPLLLFVIAVIFKLIFVTERDICIDEPYTIFNAQQSTWNIIHLSMDSERNPLLFILLLHFWIKVFGIGTLSVRFLPMLFNSLTVIFIYKIGQRICNYKSGLFAAILFILSTYNCYYGMEARTYSLLSMGTAAALFFYINILAEPENRKYIIGLIFSNIVIIYSHFFGWFIIGMEVFICLLFLKNTKVLKTIASSIVITCILFLPMVHVFTTLSFTTSITSWLGPPSKNDYLGQLHWFLNDTIVFRIVCIAFFVGIIILLIKGRLNIFPKNLLAILLWWIVPYSFMFFISFKFPMFLSRYILFNTIGFYIFISIVLFYLYKKFLYYIVSSIIIIFMAINLHINSKEFYYREVQNTVHYIKSKTLKNSILLIYPFWDSNGLIYYYNNKIFRNVNKYDSLLEKNRIFPVWHFNHAKEYLTKYTNCRIIYYQGVNDDNLIFNFLNNNYKKVDSVFYPKCFYVGVYEPLVKDSISKGHDGVIDSTFQKRVLNIQNYIKTDKVWMKKIIEKAKLKGLSTDSMLTLDAIWMINNERISH